MEEDEIANAKKKKTGPLKSTPGFLKCMRNVYLYFKEEKEKGALNIPINSFIERTAVACGVGRKTLYNYARKGLFDEAPIILQTKQKKKKSRKKEKEKDEELLGNKGKRKKLSTFSECNPGPSSPLNYPKKKSQSPRGAKNVMIQTDPRPMITPETMILGGPNSESDGFTNFMMSRDKSQQIQVISEDKLRESGSIESGPWPNTMGTLKREVDCFIKNNFWHSVYNIPDPQNCTGDLNAGRIASCQTEPPPDQLTDL